MHKFRANFGVPPGAKPMESGTPSGVPTFSLAPDQGVILRGFALTPNCFVAKTTFNQLKTFVPDPRLLVEATLAFEPHLEDEVLLNRQINRPFNPAKLRNVSSYSDYIFRLVSGKRPGVLPPIVGYHQELLPNSSDEHEVCLIPYGTPVGVLDGQTQLASHFEVWKQAPTPEARQAHGRWPLLFIVHHGVSVEVARQYFHDLNTLGVAVNTSLALSMDSFDPILRIVHELEVRVAALRGRVDYQSRQLKKRSSTIFTLQTMRQFVVNVAMGMAGMQYGTKPVDIPESQIETVTTVCAQFITAYLARFGTEIEDREHFLAGAPAVMAAHGGRLHELTTADPNGQIADIILELANVDWTKGNRWSGIAGKVRSITRGRRIGQESFAIGGPKETAYAIFAALFKPADSGYIAVRHQTETPRDSTPRVARSAIKRPHR